MKVFNTIVTLLASVATVAANTITFISHDDIHRTVYFTPNAGLEPVAPIVVPAYGSAKVNIPWKWIGNFYAVQDGHPNIPGMLGEVAFNAWNDITFFDVSAIVNPNDMDNVKEMWPISSLNPTSGCKWFPCNDAYYLPDDVQTRSTTETDLVCTLGRNGAYGKRDEEEEERRDLESGPPTKRKYVLLGEEA